tara:strand:+ start:162 stop:440 length:279 start_codon:yes stop_codon:yes gene_type:complete
MTNEQLDSMDYLTDLKAHQDENDLADWEKNGWTPAQWRAYVNEIARSHDRAMARLENDLADHKKAMGQIISNASRHGVLAEILEGVVSCQNS